MLIVVPEKLKRKFIKLLQSSGWDNFDVSPRTTPSKNSRKENTIFIREPISEELRWKVWKRDNFTCKKCKKRKFLQIDHIIPVSKNGTTEEKNLQTLCKTCNRKKGNKL